MKEYLQLFMNKTPTLYHTSQGKAWLIVLGLVLIVFIVLIALNALNEKDEQEKPADIGDIIGALFFIVIIFSVIKLCDVIYGFSLNDRYVVAKDVRYRTAVINQAHREYPCVVAFKSNNSSGEPVTHYYLAKQYPQLGKTSTFHAYQLQIKQQSADSGNNTKQNQLARIKNCSVKALPFNSKQGSVKDSTAYLKHELKEHTDWMKKSTN